MFTDLSFLLAACLLASAQELPRVTVDADNTVLRKSCRVEIPSGAVIADRDGNGVIQIGAADIVVEFAPGAVLRGSPQATRPDEYEGYGIRLEGHRGVTIRNARISGYRCAVWASDADGLTLERIDASDNRRSYLKSTPVAEDGADWLSPHSNDNNEWLSNYGAALYIEDSAGVTVRNCKVWHGQNGLCLDRVNDSKVYDNDFSFNSGWGLALWRSSRNVISRNAIDFCVRGYSHGVYNRGQDSAGILMFEQNNDNVIAENSATHGGDCFFGFAGREALGETGKHPQEWYRRRGNNNNLLVNNDFSYAPAHGIEMTFSFGNKIIGNRLVENAICGVWGGYSQETLIAGNYFEANGQMGYGLERGGVNIEHGKGNRIVRNTFGKDKCGVHLWWDADEGLSKRPWAKANGTESRDNLIAANAFVGEQLVFHFRGPSTVTVGPNDIRDASEVLRQDQQAKVVKQPEMQVAPLKLPKYPVYGRTRPVGARKELRGRQNIIMTEWGPWDHASPLVRRIESSGASVTYDLHEMPAAPRVRDVQGRVTARVVIPEGQGLPKLTVEAARPGVYPYRFRVVAGDFEKVLEGTLVNTTWQATFFKWSKNTDPRKRLAAWRRLAEGDSAVAAQAGRLSFKYGWGGPGDLKLSPELEAAGLGGDYFGMIARTSLALPAGRWEFTTLSDDGVRVTADGQPVIENWTWHPPRRDTGTFQLAADKTVEIVVEHFEIDGYATLDLQISRAD